jgi:hypothetical protein
MQSKKKIVRRTRAQSQEQKITASSLEIKFEKLWKRLFADIVLQSEVRVCRDRRFRFDFAHPATKVAIEIHGGLWMGKRGGHTSAAGRQRDCEKMCVALAEALPLGIAFGWTVFTLSGAMITPLYLRMIRNAIVARQRAFV